MTDKISSLKAALENEKYICDDNLATALFVALSLGRPLLVEGAAGVGKTEVSKAMAAVLGRELVRLQCHVGMDETRSLYEWNYQKQLLSIQAHTSSGGRDGDEILESIFSEDYLMERPLLKSIRSEKPVVLLVDELDKTDEEFEAFLLELLAEFQVTIPEFGTVTARSQPFVVLTSNNTRPLSDALRRRCVYVYLEYPTIEKELQIINARFPNANKQLARDVAEAVAYLRTQQRIIKKPSISETLDWLSALESFGIGRLDAESARATLGTVLKNHGDMEEAEKDGKFRALH